MKLRFAELSQKYQGKPFELGGFEEGFDCFSLVLTFMDEWGQNIPDSFRGWTRDSYKKLYNYSPKKALGTMKAYFREAFDRIDEEPSAGDVVIFDDGAAGVVAANGNALVVTREEGVKTIALRDFPTYEVYRCRKK